MDKKIYLITIIENIGDNETAVYHEGIVIGDEEKAIAVQKKAFYDSLSYWMRVGGYDDDGYTLEEIFEVYHSLNKLVALSKNREEICCEIEEVNEI